MKRSAILIGFIFLISRTLTAQWVQTNGPYGGSILSLGICDTSIFAWGGGGVMLSTNDGMTWSAAGTPFGSFHSMAQQGMNIFAASRDDGVFLSPDNGASWTSVNNGLPMLGSGSTYAITCLVVSNTNLFVGGYFGVFRSTNSGTDWIGSNIGVPYEVTSLAVSSSNIFAGTSSGIFRSTDNGASWDTAGNGLPPAAHIHCLIPNNGIIFAGIYDRGTYRSTDNGITWTEVMRGQTNCFAVTGINLYAGTFNGVFLTTDYGESWSNAGSSPALIVTYTLAIRGTNIYAGTPAGVIRSTDFGNSWTEVNTGLTYASIVNLAVSGSSLFGCGQGGIHRSTDYGVNWIPVNTGLSTLRVHSLDGDSANLFALTDDGLFHSTNNGTSWTPTSSIRNIPAFAISEDYLFAGLGGVSRSSDNGVSWTAVNSGLTGLGGETVGFLKVFGTNIFARTSDGLFLSTNNGANWAPANSGLFGVVRAMAHQGTSFYAGTVGSEDKSGVYRSTDNGAIWSHANTGIPLPGYYDGVVSLTVSGGHLFAGSHSGNTFVSDNDATTWTMMTRGWPAPSGDSPEVQLAVSGQSLIAGTTGYGIWRRSISEMTAISTSKSIIDFGNIIPGSTYTDSITITNVSSEILVTDSVQIDSPYLQVRGVPISLNPGDSCTVTVQYKPTSCANYHHTLTFWFNGNRSVAGVHVYAIADSPLRYSRQSIAFGTVLGLGLFHQDSVTIYNDRNGILTVDTVYCDNNEVTVGITESVIPAGDSCRIRISYRPLSYGNLTCRLLFSFKDVCARGTIPITAWAIPDEMSWVQTTLTGVAVLCFATSEGSLFALTDTVLYHSLNNGKDWSRTRLSDGTKTPFNYGSNYLLAMNSTHLFVGGGYPAGCGGGRGDWGECWDGEGWVSHSTDHGITWHTSYIASEYIRALAINGTSLIAGTSGGEVFLSTDNGVSWTMKSIIFPIRSFIVNDNKLFAGTSGGVFLSTDNGINWSAVNAGLTNNDISTLALCGTNLVAATQEGVFLSTNSGRSWRGANNGLSGQVVHRFASFGTNIFAGTDSAVYLSTDNGASWTTDSVRFTNPRLSALAVSGTSLFVGTWGNGVWKCPLSEMITAVAHQLQSGWNLLSLPIHVYNHHTAVNYPHARSCAFEYTGNYKQCDSLEVGRGYWLKVDSDNSYLLYGDSVFTDTVVVSQRWNIIGSISTPILASSITSDPSGIVTSSFWGYDGTKYNASDTIYPGKGYWVRVNEGGKLILSTTPSAIAASNHIRIVASGEIPPPPPTSEILFPKSQIPTEFALEQNYPNPFNPTTEIRFEVPVLGFMSLKVYNVLGQAVATLVDGVVEPGYRSVTWAASAVPSGVYFYRMTAGTFSKTKKLLLLR
jgi:ASPM-SPD-2-Hydin domain-containing protein/type IX secretion system substrate protein